MTDGRATRNESVPTLVAGRYALLERLGKGGVASVDLARDTVTGRIVALKRLDQRREGDGERLVQLFRQEFHTLSQLAHPHVVAVYDYGVGDEGPYYTMERLDGGDLADGSPWDWRPACALARDVCSALSLIHSRRLVYRDLSPRNVRCTSDGRAKLLDFGALSPMGPAKVFVGTPAISAPEAVYLQPLDARTDLYSLGATLYFALTGRRPYPANSLPQLHYSWRTPPRLPSELVPAIPPALDALVMELLQLEAGLRPVSAAEVMDRLSAIAGLERDEQQAVASKAYLSTPALVGRDTSLGRFRRSLKALSRGIGGALAIQGVRGVGRTRFLDACILEAKLAGVTVLRADATDAYSGEYGVTRTLIRQLFTAAPDAARAPVGARGAILSWLVPELRAEFPEPLDGVVPEAQVQPALRHWLFAVAAIEPLIIAIDDAQGIDAPSAALLSLLAREAKSHPLIVLSSLPSDGATVGSKALALLVAESRALLLGPLGEKRSERLLRSLFGDVPNVQLVAHRLHDVSKGLPRDLMQLAQHLVDAELVRYSSGAWALPQRLDADALPVDMVEARRAKLSQLSHDARLLALALALGPEGRYTFDECVALTEHGDSSRVMRSLSELIQAEIGSQSAQDYSLGWRDTLLEGAALAEAKPFYVRLAAVFAKRPTERFREAEYLILAGAEERGLDALLRFAESSILETTTSMDAFAKLLQSLPDDWFLLYDRGLELCQKFSRPRTDEFILYTRLAGILSQLPIDATRYFAPVLGQLRHDAGLDIYAELSPTLDPVTRLKQAMGLAAKRHGEAGGGTVFDPGAAVPLLGRMVASAIGAVSTTLSVELLELLPSLAPLAPLSPALSSWQTLVDGVHARILAQSERARALYERQLERLAGPDRGGLEQTYQVAQQLGIALTLGMLEAAMGLESSLARATFVETSPLHEVNAVRIRMLYQLWQGNSTEADRLREHAELLIVERARRQTNEGAHLLRELLANALSDDLTRVRRTMNAIEPLTAHAMGWRTVLHWARAEYQRIRGNSSAALAEVEASLASMDPSGHPVWPEVAGTHVKILVSLGRFEDARAAGTGYLARAADRGIGYEQNYIKMPLSLALANLGFADAATAHAGAVIESFLALGSTGLNLGVAYETGARVALVLGARAEFDRYADLSAVHYRARTSGPLAAKYERMRHDAQRAGGASFRDLGGDADLGARATTTTELLDTLRQCTDQDERSARVLELLLVASGAEEGFLFRMENGELTLAARVGEHELPLQVLESASEYVAEQCQSDEVTILTSDQASQLKSKWTVAGSSSYRPVLLSHSEGDGLVITGLALLLAGADGSYRDPARDAAKVSRLAMDREFAVFVRH